MGVMDKFRAMGEPRQAAADPAISDGLFFRSRNKSRADAVMKIRTLIAVAVVVAGGGMSGAEVKSTLRTDGAAGRGPGHGEAATVDERITAYRGNPDPSSISGLLKLLDTAPLTEHAVMPLCGFFSEVFRSNPERMPEWIDRIAALENIQLKRALLAVVPAIYPEYGNLAEKAAGVEPGTESGSFALSGRQLQEIADANPDFAWGAYFASGKREYPLKVLQLALSPLREKAGKTFNLTAAAAHWSLLAVSRELPEVETILKTYFREAPETELRFFFRRVGETERRRLLDAERIALLPPPGETVRARPANPFAGLYRNWENRRTSSEEAERRVADYEKLLCEDSPQSDPAKIRSFIAYFYRGNLPELKPEEVETEPFDDRWAEAERITRLYRSGQDRAAESALRQLLRQLPESHLARVEFLTFARNCWKEKTPQYQDHNTRLISEIEAAVLAGKWQGRICYQWFYNLLSGNSGCGSRYWGRLEARLKPRMDQIDPWFREMIRGRAAIAWAWESRGGGWAFTVSKEGWKGFEENLDAARTHFHNALKLHPDRANPYIQLITVEMGGGTREAMIEAFKGLIRIDPENTAGYGNLLWGLLPRWGGSHELIRRLAVEAMDCSRRDIAVPSMGYQCLGQIAWDYRGMGWQNVYLDPEIRRRSDRLFTEYERKSRNTPGWNNFLFHRFCREMAELRYDDAAKTLEEYGGAEKFAKSGRWQRGDFFAEQIGTPWYDDLMLRLKLFTGKFAAPLREAERRLLADAGDAAALETLREIIGDQNLAVGEREFLIDFYARWRLNCSPQEFCGSGGKILSAFAVAGKRDRADVAQEMVAFGYRSKEHENYPGEFAYNIAKEGKDPLLLKKLHESGDPLDRRDPKLGYAPIHIASRQGNAEMVVALLELGVPVELRNRSGHTPLHIAATKKYDAVIRILLEHGADPNLGDHDGDVCLMYLPQVRAPLRIYKLFAEYPGIDLNIRNRGGETPLHFMARSGTPVEIVRYLAGRGMEINIRDNGGKTPLDIAEAGGNRELAEYLAGIGGRRGNELPPEPGPARRERREAAAGGLGVFPANSLCLFAAGLLLIALAGAVRKRRGKNKENR